MGVLRGHTGCEANSRREGSHLLAKALVRDSLGAGAILGSLRDDRGDEEGDDEVLELHFEGFRG